MYSGGPTYLYISGKRRAKEEEEGDNFIIRHNYESALLSKFNNHHQFSQSKASDLWK